MHIVLFLMGVNYEMCNSIKRGGHVEGTCVEGGVEYSGSDTGGERDGRRQ